MTPKISLFAAFALLAGAAALPAADPTPTPEPRLTGGFGKAAAPPARKQVEKKGVRITNDSLVTDPQKGKLTTSQRVVTPVPTGSAARTPGARTPSGPTRTPGPATVAEGQAPPASAATGEEYWRNESRLARERVAQLKETIARLEADTRKMEADFYSWDDGAYRDGVIKPAWDKAREDLATARQELPLAERALAELPEQARKAGALPGWLRE
jgi:hypothetical protein